MQPVYHKLMPDGAIRLRMLYDIACARQMTGSSIGGTLHEEQVTWKNSGQRSLRQRVQFAAAVFHLLLAVSGRRATLHDL